MPRVSVKQISPSDCSRFLDLVSGGTVPWRAARDLGFPGSNVFRRYAKTDPEFADAYEAAKEECELNRADFSDDRLDEWVAPDDAPVPLKQTWLKAWNPRRYGEKQHVELTGKDDGPIEVAIADARDSLARKLASLAERTGTAEVPPES